MAVRVMVKANGEPDMRYAHNRRLFLSDPTKNLDESADIRLGINKDKDNVVTRQQMKKKVMPNLRENYFIVSPTPNG
jgi:hypothetical protein